MPRSSSLPPPRSRIRRTNKALPPAAPPSNDEAPDDERRVDVNKCRAAFDLPELPSQYDRGYVDPVAVALEAVKANVAAAEGAGAAAGAHHDDDGVPDVMPADTSSDASDVSSGGQTPPAGKKKGVERSEESLEEFTKKVAEEREARKAKRRGPRAERLHRLRQKQEPIDLPPPATMGVAPADVEKGKLNDSLNAGHDEVAPSSSGTVKTAASSGTGGIGRLENDDGLVRVVFSSSADRGSDEQEPEEEFILPVSLVAEREKEMAAMARENGIGDDRWSGSLLARKLNEILGRNTESAETIGSKLLEKMHEFRGAVHCRGDGTEDSQFGGIRCSDDDGIGSFIPICGVVEDADNEGINDADNGDEESPYADSQLGIQSKPYTFVLDPQAECASAASGKNTLVWTPALTSCIRSYYNTGNVSVPEDCRGNDVLLALEYFGIVYSPDQLVFDSFGCYLRVKLWSDYYNRRGAMANWVTREIMRAHSRASYAFVTCPEPEKGPFYLGQKKLEVFYGGLVIAKEDDGAEVTHSCSVVHDFFNDTEDDTIPLDQSTVSTNDSNPYIDALIRQDFCSYLETSLPGTNITFSYRQVTVGAPNQVRKTTNTRTDEGNLDEPVKMSTRAVLHIDFTGRGRKRKSKVKGKEKGGALEDEVKAEMTESKETDATTASPENTRSTAQDGTNAEQNGSAATSQKEARSIAALDTAGEQKDATATSQIERSSVDPNWSLLDLEVDDDEAENVPIVHVNSDPGNEESTIVSALTAPYGMESSSVAMSTLGGASKPEAASTVAPDVNSAAVEISDNTEVAQPSNTAKVVGGEGEAPQRYINAWVVEEDKIDGLPSFVLPNLNLSDPLNLSEFLGGGKETSNEGDKQGNAAPGAPSPNNNPQPNNDESTDIVDMFQSLSKTMTAFVYGEEEKKEPFYEHIDPAERKVQHQDSEVQANSEPAKETTTTTDKSPNNEEPKSAAETLEDINAAWLRNCINPFATCAEKTLSTCHTIGGTCGSNDKYVSDAKQLTGTQRHDVTAKDGVLAPVEDALLTNVPGEANVHLETASLSGGVTLGSQAGFEVQSTLEVESTPPRAPLSDSSTLGSQAGFEVRPTLATALSDT